MVQIYKTESTTSGNGYTVTEQESETTTSAPDKEPTKKTGSESPQYSTSASVTETTGGMLIFLIKFNKLLMIT